MRSRARAHARPRRPDLPSRAPSCAPPDRWDAHARVHAVLQSKKYAADFEMWDGTADNLPPEWLGAADAVTCHMRISEYLRDEQTAAHFFQTAAALLKPGGLLYGVMLDQAAVWTAAQKGKVEVKGQGQKTRSRAFTLFLESDSFEPEYFGTPFLLRAEDGLGDKVAHFLGHIPSIVAVAEVRTLRSLGAGARWSTRLGPCRRTCPARRCCRL